MPRAEPRRTTKGRTFKPEPLTAAEVASLIKCCSNRAPTGIRNRALIGLLFRSGLRISEALALKPKDLDADRGTVAVLHGMGGKARVSAMDPGAFALVTRWLDVRRKHGIKRGANVFSTLKGTPMQTSYVRQLLPRLAEKAGLSKRVHAHGLRHSFAKELREEGVDLLVVSKALGHSNVAVTHRYIDSLSPQDVIDAVRQREWSA